MRKLIARSVLAMLAVVVFSSTASAVPIPIGYLQWSGLTDPQGGQFNIINQTGANQQVDASCPLCFPIEDQLLFNANGDLALHVLFDDASTADLTPGSGLSPNPDTISWDSAFFLNPQPTQVTLSGTLPAAIVTLEGAGWAGQWSIGGNFFTVPGVLGDGINPLGDDFPTAIIYVEGEQANAVPEPATFLLFGAGLIGLVARRRMVAKR